MPILSLCLCRFLHLSMTNQCSRCDINSSVSLKLIKWGLINRTFVLSIYRIDYKQISQNLFNSDLKLL